MKKKITFLLIFFYFFSHSQDIFKNYKPIESTGNIPDEFLIKSSEKINDEIDDFTSGEKGKTKKHKKDFLVSSTFTTKNILLSGKVLFNDPVTKYINKVASEVFKSNPDLNKEDFKIYAYKSPIVNAFAFNDGLVLINLGLIAQLENEAQLAFILSHEFTHVVNNDAIDLFLSEKEMQEGDLYKNISYDDIMLYKSKYSQEKEFTADMQGLEYYKNTKYSLKPITGVFDVLKYSYLPFDDIKFDTTYFENDYYQFPDEYTLAELNPISPHGMEDEDEDILKTHPETEERRETILEEINIKELKDKTKKIYIVSTGKEFKKIQNICRFEMPRMYLLHGYYEMAFYNVYLLENLGFKNNIYLDKLKVKAIGQMARNVNNGNRPSKSDLSDIKEHMQGESQQVYYFFNSLARKKKEFNVFAVEYTYKILKKYPKDEELNNMFSNLLYELYDETNLKFSSFKKKSKYSTVEKENIVETDSLKTDEMVESEKKNEKLEKEKLIAQSRDEDSKYNKIEKKIEEEEEVEIVDKKKTKKSKEKYYKSAFVEYMDDEKFTKKAKKIEKEYKAETNKDLSKEEIKTQNKIERLNRNRGLALGVDKIVVVNPMYFVIDKDKVNHYKSEKRQEDYNDLIALLGKKSKLEVETIDVHNLINNKTETFNNSTILNEWISEQFLFDDILEFTSIEKEKIDKLTETYGTKYFLWTGVFSIKNRNHTYMFNILFDIEEGKMVLKNFKDVGYKTNKTIIKSELYHIFDQITTKRKIK